MTFRRHRGAVVLVVAALLAAASACSTKAEDTSAGPAGDGAVKSGTGVQGDTIRLGVLTDLSGVFAAIATDLTNGEKLYWDQRNAQGGVCGKYKVELDVKDTNYNVQNSVQLYAGMKSDVLAIQQTAGSPPNTALLEQYKSDRMVNFPYAFARNLTVWEGNAIPGATYDVEMVNGYDEMLSKGLVKDGDAVGHIYFEGEYGANALAGSKYMAQKHGFKLVEAKIKPTDTDMTPQIVQFKTAGVKMIVLTTSGAQTASAASVAQAQGLDVPILGSNPVYSPGLLKGGAGPALRKNLYVAAPVSSFDKHPELLTAYLAAFPGTDPSTNAILGYGSADAMRQLLDKACEDGDLTREGLLTAKKSLTAVETGGLLAPLDLSKTGESPSRKSFILRPTDGPGGLAVEREAFEGEDTKAFTPTG